MSCTKLTTAEIRYLTRILCHHPDEDLTAYTARTAALLASPLLPARLKCPCLISILFSRQPRARDAATPSSLLCVFHSPLNAYTIHSLFQRLEVEVGRNLDSLMLHSQRLSVRQRDLVERLRALHDALVWLEPGNHQTTFPRSPARPFQAQAQLQAEVCEACTLANIGGDPGLLLDLRTVLLSRTKTPELHRHGAVRPPPTLLGFAEAWLRGLEVGEGVLEENWREAQGLKVVRKRIWRERLEMDRYRPSGGPEPETHRCSRVIDVRDLPDLDAAAAVRGGGGEGDLGNASDVEIEIIEHYAALSSTLYLSSQGGESETTAVNNSRDGTSVSGSTRVASDRAKRSAEEQAKSYQDLLAMLPLPPPLQERSEWDLDTVSDEEPSHAGAQWWSGVSKCARIFQLSATRTFELSIMTPKKGSDQRKEEAKKKALEKFYDEHMKHMSADELADLMQMVPKAKLVNVLRRSLIQTLLRTSMNEEDAEKVADTFKTPKTYFPTTKRKVKAGSEEPGNNSDEEDDADFPKPPPKKRPKITEEERKRIEQQKQQKKADEKSLADARKQQREATTRHNQALKLAKLQEERQAKLTRELQELRKNPLPANRSKRPGSQTFAKMESEIKKTRSTIEEQRKIVSDAAELKKAKEAAFAAEQARLEQAKINVRRLPAPLLQRLASYKIDLATVQEWNVADIFDDKAIKVLEEVLDILQEWTPIDVIENTWQLLDSMAISHQLSRAERAAQRQNGEANGDNPDDNLEVTRQVRGILKSKYNTLIAFAEQCFWLARMSERIDNLERPNVSQQNRSGDVNEAMPAARTKKEAIYEAYLIQEAGGLAKYEAQYQRLDQQAHFDRRRKWWKGQKLLGSKLREIIKQLGWGILACMPPDLTISAIDRWNALHVRAIAHGLSNGAAAKDWKNLCSYFDDWLPAYFENGQEHPKVVSKRDEFQKTFSEKLENMASETTAAARRNMDLSIEDILDEWPQGVQLTLDSNFHEVAVNRENVTSFDALYRTGYVDETAINAIISLFNRNNSSRAVLFPAGYMVMDSDRTAFDFENLGDQVGNADRILMPVHHGRGGNGDHWTLVEIDLRARTIRHLDSLLSPRRFAQVQERIQEWLRQSGLMQDDTQDFAFEAVQDAQQQSNGIDCGLFLLSNMDALANGNPRAYRTNPDGLRRSYARSLLNELRRSQREQEVELQRQAAAAAAAAPVAIGDANDTIVPKVEDQGVDDKERNGTD